jgi:CheY-like chemotaxis protein
MAAGFDHHLTKPIDPDHLERLIREFFGSTAVI